MRWLDSLSPTKGRKQISEARKGVRAALERLAQTLDEDVTGAAAGVARPPPNGKANGGSHSG